jgi:hypothetical protein
MKIKPVLIHTLFFITLAAAFHSCSKSTVKATASWVNKEKIREEPYKSVLIIVLTENMDAKVAIENDLAVAARERGLKAYTFLDVFGPIATVEFLPKHEIIQKRASELPAETIFTVAVVDVMSTTRYHPSSEMMYTPVASYGYYGNFGGYYGNVMSVYQPGYYTSTKKYFLESNLYDVASGELLMSIQSKAVDPQSIKKASTKYTATLMEEIRNLRKQNGR